MFVDTASTELDSRPRPRWVSMSLPVVAGAGAAGVLALLHFRDPHSEGSYGVCPFYTLTGFWCPGCGGLRGLHNLTDGRILDAIQSNIFVLPLLLGFLAYWVNWLVVGWRGGGVPALPRILPRNAVWAAAGFLLIYTVFRNTPWGSWLAPV